MINYYKKKIKEFSDWLVDLEGLEITRDFEKKNGKKKFQHVHRCHYLQFAAILIIVLLLITMINYYKKKFEEFSGWIVGLEMI